MGSPVSAIGTSFGVIGIVSGPPKGSRGSTGWGHLSRGGHMGCRGCALAYMGQGHQPQEAHAPRVSRRKSPRRGRHLLGALGRRDSSPWPPPLSHLGLPPPLGVCGAPAHFGLGSLPLHPMGPPGIGGPTRWTPGTLPVVPVQYQVTPKLSRCRNNTSYV